MLLRATLAVGLLMTAAVAIAIGMAKQQPSDLTALLSPQCEQACLWGIEPGVSTVADVEALLWLRPIPFEKVRTGLDYGQPDYDGPMSYRPAPDAYYDFISHANTISIDTLGDNTTDTVNWIMISTPHFFPEAIIDAFGYPTYIYQSAIPSQDQYRLSYVPLGVSIHVGNVGTLIVSGEEHENYRVRSIWLQSASFMQANLADSNSVPANPCLDDPSLCHLVTATPTPGLPPLPTMTALPR